MSRNNKVTDHRESRRPPEPEAPPLHGLRAEKIGDAGAPVDAGNQSVKRLLLVLIGTFLGLVFLYLAFRDISLADLADGMKEVQLWYLLPATVLLLLVQFLRAYRFALIVTPFCRLGLKSALDITNLWAALNMLLPARLAELVRPYLLQQLGASFSSSLGAVMVERFFDLSGLLTLLAVVLWSTPQTPVIYTTIGGIMLLVLIVGYATVLILLARRDSVQSLVEKLLRWLPGKVASWVGGAAGRLVDGLGIMASVKQVLLLFVCSVALWTTFAAMTYVFLKAFSISVPFLVAITIQIFICFGVALPSAPGFIGTFHAAGRYSLALFGVAAIPAVSFATVYHFFSLIGCLALGLISYWSSNFRFDHSIFKISEPAGDPASNGEPPPVNTRHAASTERT